MPIGNRVVSGLYKGTVSGYNFEARLDVDGTYPQMEFSLTLTNQLPGLWIARMQSAGTDKWEGDIWYRHDKANTIVIGGIKPNKLAVEYISSGSGKSLKFYFKKDGTNLWWGTIPRTSDYFRQTQLELDYEQGVERWLTYDTSSLPRPAGVAAEELTLEKIYGRAGIEITRSSAVNAVSGTEAGANAGWNDQ